MKSIFRLFAILFVLLSAANGSRCYAAKLDTTGIGKKIKYCYELNKSRDEKLITEAKKLLPFAHAYPNSDIELSIYTLVARGFFNKRLLDSSNYYLLKVKQPLQKYKSYDAIFSFLTTASRVEYFRRSYNKSIDYDLEAYKLAIKYNNKRDMAIALNNVAHTNLNTGRTNQALEHLLKAKDLALAASDSATYAYTLSSIGSVYFQKDIYSKAIPYYKESAQILSKLKINSELRLCYSIIADCYYNAKNYKNALYYVSQSERYRGQDSTDYFSLYNSSVSAKSYFKLGELEIAKDYADFLIANINSGDAEDLKIDFLRIGIEIYSKTNNYDKAIGLIKTYDSLTSTFADSLKNAYAVDKEFDFRFSNVKAELNRIKAEKEVQEELNELQKRILLVSIAAIGILIVAIIIGLISYRRKIETSKLLNQKNVQIEEQLQIVKKQNELQLLTIGVVGHDLRGPLASSISIKYILDKYYEKQEYSKIREILDLHFDSLLRMQDLTNNLITWVLSAQSGLSLNFAQVDISKVVGQIAYNLHDLIKGKEIVFTNNLTSSDLAFVDAPSTETILRNIIQNAIKFTPQGKKITVSSSINAGSNEITITITDQGQGMNEDVLEKLNSGKRMISVGTKGEKGNGLGLIMIQTLLTLNNGTMHISSEMGIGTSFSVILPMNYSK